MIDIRTVLCPVDLTPLSKQALLLAVDVCKKVGARLVLEHNLDARPPSYLGVSWMWSGDHGADEKAKEDAATDRIRTMLNEVPGDIEREAKITRGQVDMALLHVARALPAELVVMGTHGPSSAEHKSLTEKIVLHAPCPVLTLGEGYEPENVMAQLAGTAPESLDVIVPIDLKARRQPAFDFGVALAERMPHRLILVHVVEPGKAVDEEVVRQRLEIESKVPEALADRVVVEIKEGHRAECLLEAATEHKAIFILMAAHKKSPFKRFLFGTTTLTILRESEAPVLFLPPK